MDLRAVDLNLLVALDRLLVRGSVTLAARDLGVSQPAMSRTLERLRALFEDPLFVRHGRGWSPTPRALALAAPLEEALGALRRVVAPPPEFHPARAHGELRLALGEELQLLYGEAILRAIHAEAPGVDVRFLPVGAPSLDDSRRGTIDLAMAPDLTPLPPSPNGPPDLTELVRRRLYTRRFVVVHAASRAAPVDTMEAYCAADHVLLSLDGSGRGFVDEYLASHGRRRRVLATVTSFHAAAHLAARTHLVAVIPEDIARSFGPELRVVLPPLPLPDLTVYLWWQPVRTPDPRHRFFRERVAAEVTAAAARLLPAPPAAQREAAP